MTPQQIRTVLQEYNPLSERIFHRGDRFLDDLLHEHVAPLTHDAKLWKRAAGVGLGCATVGTYVGTQLAVRTIEATLIGAGKLTKLLGREAKRSIDYLATRYNAVRQMRDRMEQATRNVKQSWNTVPAFRAGTVIAGLLATLYLAGSAITAKDNQIQAREIPSWYVPPRHSTTDSVRSPPPRAGHITFPRFNNQLIIASIFQETDPTQPDFEETIRYFMRESRNGAAPEIRQFRVYLENGERADVFYEGRNFFTRTRDDVKRLRTARVIAYDVIEENVRYLGFHNARLGEEGTDSLLRRILPRERPDVLHFRGHLEFFTRLSAAQETPLVFLGGCYSERAQRDVSQVYQDAVFILTRERMDWLENHGRIRYIADAIDDVRRQQNPTWTKVSAHARAQHSQAFAQSRMRMPGD